MKTYILSASFLASAGVHGLLVSEGAQEVSAASMVQHVTVTAELDPTSSDGVALRAIAKRQLCPEAETKGRALSKDSCAIEDKAVISATFGDPIQLSGNLPFAGTWAKGQPQ